MTNRSASTPWQSPVAFWCRIWQMQFEQTLAFWGAMAQMMPHQHASDLSAEAEAMKAPAPRKPRARAAAH